MSLTLSAVCVCVSICFLSFPPKQTRLRVCVCVAGECLGFAVLFFCCNQIEFSFSFVFSTHNSLSQESAPVPGSRVRIRFPPDTPAPASKCVWVCLIAKCVYNWFNCWRENASTTTTTDNRVCVMTTTDKSFFPSFFACCAGWLIREGRDTDAVRDLQCPRSPRLGITPKAAPNTLDRGIVASSWLLSLSVCGLPND